MSPFDPSTCRSDPLGHGSANQEQQDTASEAPRLVIPVHACIPGRVRWHVPGLRGNLALKAALDGGLRELPGLHDVRASTDTGNLLTLFDPAIRQERLASRIAALARGDTPGPDEAPGATHRPDWHARPAAEAVAALRASATEGLTEADAQARRAEYGANALPPPRTRSELAIFAGQLQTLPVGLLAIAGGLSLLMGGVIEAVAILGVVFANTVLGGVVESRSERTIRSLTAAGHEPAHVIRGGTSRAIPVENVVPGELIELQPGTIIPADARVVSARELRVSQAMLTGESLPVAKHPEPSARAAPLADRSSMVFRGTAVTGGGGTAVVVATGTATEMGRIQRLLAGEDPPQTMMQRQLDALGRQLVWASLAACAAVMGVGALRGIALLQLLRSGISLAVAAVPEGLPTIATTTLALGIEDMRKRGVLVRRLGAVEALASVGVVCFDKTGTLTLNRMRVAEVTSGGRRFRTSAAGALLDADGQPAAAFDEPLAWLLRICVLCSDAAVPQRADEPDLAGSATEVALVRLALHAGLDAAGLRRDCPRLAVRRRTEGYRFMVTIHRWPRSLGQRCEGVLVAVKGSPAEVLDLCVWELRDGVRQVLGPERRVAILRANEAMAADALRVLGFAFGEAPAPSAGESDVAAAARPGGLTWAGLAGLADPVRPGMPALMRELQSAGVRTVMMTGDQVATARAVARELGLAPDGDPEVFDGTGMEQLAPRQLAAAARRAHVFARVSPTQKLHLVRALQGAGERVAMTGDGINDSPALKAADVGLAMGGHASSEAAREVADLVLRTDNLAALATAVERGRATHVNVGKSIRYLLATNLSEILVVLGATAAGFGEPLTTMQLLWINLVSDVLPGLGLACEPPEPGLMRRPPVSPAAEILGAGEIERLAVEGGLLAGGSLLALSVGALRHGAGSPRARTMSFASLVTAQLLHALTTRSGRSGLLAGRQTEALRPNRALTSALLASAGLQLAGLLAPGVRSALGIARLDALDLIVTGAGSVLPYIANEALKTARAGPA